MKKVHMVIDVEKCIDCNNCFDVCKDEFVDKPLLPRNLLITAAVIFVIAIILIIFYLV